MTDETQATPSPKREMTQRALEAHAEHMRRLAAHYMKALEEVVLSKDVEAASATAARALGSNPECPEQPQPFAWYWFDHLRCLYMTGNDRMPDVPAHAKPLYEHLAPPAPPPPSTYVAPEIDGGRFEEWSLADFAAQCRMQSREQLDPEFSRFMAALAKRLSALATEGKS